MWHKPIAITIDGNTFFSSIRKCCKHYGIKLNTVFNKVRRSGMSITDAIQDSIRTIYEVDGMQFRSIVDMSKYYNIPRSTLGYRLLRGWSISDAVHVPPGTRRTPKRYNIGGKLYTAEELCVKFGIPKKKVYRIYGGKNK